MLEYEYVGNGNLEQWLHGDIGPSIPLTWEIRMDIILGIAKGSLASNGFSGTLSPSITKLNFLVSLDLQNNNLSGDLPDYLSSISNLQILYLANNSLNGPIPPTWGYQQCCSDSSKMAASAFLEDPNRDLSSNDMTGGIPLQLFSIPTYKSMRD